MKKLFLAVFLLAWIACKDELPASEPHPGYTLSGKIINGTTMQPAVPGLVMDLMVNYSDPFEVDWEHLGKCTVQHDGSFEIVYQHSELAQRSRSYMRFESSHYFSPSFPKNQDVVDTVIYESTGGDIDIMFKEITPLGSDTFFLGYYDDDNAPERQAITDTITSATSGLYKSFRATKPRKVFWWGRGINEFKLYLNENSKVINITGDPFTDSLEVAY